MSVAQMTSRPAAGPENSTNFLGPRPLADQYANMQSEALA